MSTQPSAAGLSSKKILLAHSNVGETALLWHERRRQAAVELGYDLSVFNMIDYHPYTIYPRLDRLWRRRDPALMRLYEILGTAIARCDVFIHHNGLLIHPEFLQQFKKLKIYHCADDPDASDVVSRPVATHYDICAISNPACIAMYKKWGCKNTLFWPIGSFSRVDDNQDASDLDIWGPERDIPLVFIGSKQGATSIRIIGKWLGLYRRRRRMARIERAFPELVAYGSGWARGHIADEDIATLYRRSRVGVNIHNTVGPVNGRLYDLAAFGICQICDNKATLGLVFEDGKEIVGFQTIEECLELIRYFISHPDEAQRIGMAARQRYLRDYTMKAIWINLFAAIDEIYALKTAPVALS